MNNIILSIMLALIITISSLTSVFAIPSVSQSSHSKKKNVKLVDSRLKYGEIENQIINIENQIYDLDTQIEPL